MGKTPKPKIVKPSNKADEEEKSRAAEAERRRATQQRGRAAQVFTPFGAFGRAESASAGLKSSFG